MAELLIRVTDKINPDFYLNCQCTKRGDVIDVRPDGWPWGTLDQTQPFWRILKVPALSVSEAAALLAPELDTDPLHPSRTLQRRAFKWDFDAAAALGVVLPPSLVAYLADDTRAQPSFTITNQMVSLANVRKLKVQKAAIVDPVVA